VELGDAPVDQVLAGRERVGCMLAQLSPGCGHEHDTVTVALGACHGAARDDDLVIGMGVEEDDCVRHGT